MMFLPQSVRVFVAIDPVDMRKSHHALAGLVTAKLGMDPLEGHLFVFLNRNRTQCKILFFDRNGLAIWYKRLEAGTFQLPSTAGGRLEIDPATLAMILEGIDLRTATRRKRYQHHRASLDR